MLYVDTNYFIQFLIKDNPDQFKIVEKLFNKVSSGQEKLFTSIITFFEINWLLSSFYLQDKKEIIQTLLLILQMRFIDIEKREMLVSSVKIYSKYNISLEDAYYIILTLLHNAKMATFDRKLSKVFNLCQLAKS